jgi:hypothetical protein
LALIFASGGESGTPDFTSYTSGVVCSTTYKKTGNYSLLVAATNNSAIQTFPYGLTDFYMSFFTYTHFGSGGCAHWRFQNSGNTVIRWYATNSGSPFTFNVGESTAIGSTISKIYSDVWYLIEIHIILHATTGLIHVRVNGVDEIMYTGNTIAAGYSTISNFYIFASYTDTWIDDLIFNDTTGSINNSWMGGVKIVGLRPIGPGSSTQWTPSTGANWQCVDEAPISEADYVASDIAGALDLYDLASLPDGVCLNVSFLGLKVFNGVSRTGLTVSYIQNAMRTNSVNTYSSIYNVSTVMQVQSVLWDLNPITGTTWTYTDINALESGIKLV